MRSSLGHSRPQNPINHHSYSCHVRSPIQSVSSACCVRPKARRLLGRTQPEFQLCGDRKQLHRDGKTGVASYTYIYTYTYIHLEGCRRYIYIICICFTVIYTQKSYTSHIHVLSCADNGASQNALKLTRDLKSRHGTPWIHQVGVRLGWGQSHNHNWDIRLVLKKTLV